MNEELAKLVDKYSSERKLVDRSFIDKVCFDLVDYYDLHDYLKDVKINDLCSKHGSGSSYHPYNKTMSIELCHNKNYKKLLKSSFDEEHHYWYNLFVLMSILHEMEHVKQEKLKEEKYTSLESSLIYLNDILDPKMDEDVRNFISRIVKLIRYGNYYTRNHDKAPIERLANLRSYKDIIDIINKIDKFDLETLLMYKYYTIDLFTNQLECGYKLIGDKTNSPSVDYLCGMKSTHNKELIMNSNLLTSDGLNTRDKMTYGLELLKEEYEYMKDKSLTLSLFNIR